MASSPPNPNPNPNPNPSLSRNCEECDLQPWKYRCPGCLIQTCSLPCVNSHKRRTGCNGKRDPHTSRVVPLALFDDDLLISGLYPSFDIPRSLSKPLKHPREKGESCFSLLRAPPTMASSPPNPNPNPNPSRSRNCEECDLQPWKYRCPGCLIQTCSLPCVNSHMRRTGCNGKRDPHTSRVVPLALFDDDLLISDYNLLEEAKRVAESSRRMRNDLRLNDVSRLPMRQKVLRDAAIKRRTCVLFMPKGMSKREKNQSLYSKRDNSIFWTIEWKFPSAGVILTDHGVGESENLSTVIGKHLVPNPWNNPLRPYSNIHLDELKFFIQKNPKVLKFRELDIKVPLVQQLSYVIVLEFPVIHVLLPSESYNFEVESVEQKTMASTSPKGTVSEEFEEREVLPDHLISSQQMREDAVIKEKFEEGEVLPDHLISAQQMRDNAMTMARACNSEARVSKAAVELLKPSPQKNSEVLAEGRNENSKPILNSAKLLEGAVDFDFDKELRDAYSKYLGEINPDDFLSFDDGINYKDMELVKGSGNSSHLGGDLVPDDELEEGEIPS